MMSAPLKITSGFRLDLESSAPTWRRERASFALPNDFRSDSDWWIGAAKHLGGFPFRAGGGASRWGGKSRSDLKTRASVVRAAKNHGRIPTRFGKLRSDLETRASELRAAERFPL